jgi:hypothetical protein
MTLALPDDLYAAIQAAAARVTPSERAQFLADLAAELERHPVIGPGLVHRAAAALQRRFTVEAVSGDPRGAAAGGAQPPRLERGRRRGASCHVLTKSGFLALSQSRLRPLR